MSNDAFAVRLPSQMRSELEKAQGATGAPYGFLLACAWSAAKRYGWRPGKGVSQAYEAAMKGKKRSPRLPKVA